MSLAQRVRDFRYSKGWGPDELASRAAISRTALYQIESGKTELPRAGTLRRIAMALDVSMDTLLGNAESNTATGARPTRPAVVGSSTAWSRGNEEWYPAEGTPMTTSSGRVGGRFENGDGHRFTGEYGATSFDGLSNGRERELVTKFQELLGSPFGDAVARIVDETYRLLPQHASATPVAVSASVRGL
jgi:transcriptional regulator with XRE-family HTH domain